MSESASGGGPGVSGGPGGRPPLRVLHVDAAREWRGGQNQLRLLARELERGGEAEQTVAGGRGSRLLDALDAAGVPTCPLPWEAALDPRALAGLVRRVRGPDVVHAHSSHALQATVLALALSGGDARLVASRRLDYALRSPAVWRRADLVLAVSTAVRQVLVAGGLEAARVRVVHDGVDPDEVRPQRAGRLRDAAGLPEEAPLVGAVGALVRHKDHRTFVRAAGRVARRREDVRFVVAGEGPERAELERLRDAADLGERLRLPGHVPDAARSVADLDLLVMSSREEGLGSAALEAMAAGVPVVTTRAGGLADVAGDVLPSVPPEDPGALAGEMLRLLADEPERERVGAAGRRRLEERFTAARTADRTLEAYRDVVAWHRRRRRHARRLARTAAFRRARPPAAGSGTDADGRAAARRGRGGEARAPSGGRDR